MEIQKQKQKDTKNKTNKIDKIILAVPNNKDNISLIKIAKKLKISLILVLIEKVTYLF